MLAKNALLAILFGTFTISTAIPIVDTNVGSSNSIEQMETVNIAKTLEARRFPNQCEVYIRVTCRYPSNRVNSLVELT